MSPERYVCCEERRRSELAASPVAYSGIDYIEVLAGATTADPTYIDIVLVKPMPLPGAALAGENIRLTGGVRFPAPKVDPVVVPSPGGMEAARYRLTIAGGQPTDFSTYRLALVAGAGSDDAPAFIDPRLSAVDFSFKINCPSDFDCAPDCDAPPAALPADPTFDYRTRDYPGFRRQILDRLSELLPGFKEDDPVDFTTTLAELAAYRADQQSYRLDWVGTEAFLATARSPTSVARHARLVDYRLGQGASARVFARFAFTPGGAVTDGLTVAAQTPLLVRTPGLGEVVPAADYRRVLAAAPVVFETVAALRVWQWRDAIPFHTWGDDECRLPRGATSATLVDTSGGGLAALAVGDLLLFEEIASPTTGKAADARADRRHIVRLTGVKAEKDVLDSAKVLVGIAWSDADALPFDLIVQSRRADALAGSSTFVCAQAAGNIMLADHGASAPPPAGLGLPPSDVAALRPRLSPPQPLDESPWRPVLDRADVARIAPADLQARPQASASDLARVDPSLCTPALWLDDDFDVWKAKRDLLESGPFERDFVIETTIDNHPALRFGDDVNGLAAGLGATLSPRGRFGYGPVGNIGAGALAHIVLPQPLPGGKLVVSNPLPARGGAEAESIASVRIGAPQAFRVQERAVTAADYAEVAMRHPQVANAFAIPRWTGAWQTVLVYIDRRGGLPVDTAFRREMLVHLERFRLMGFDVAVRGAVATPLDIALRVCAQPGELRSTVAARVVDALSASERADGSRGFFHPDNFTFGSPLYLSALIKAVKDAPGVLSVTATRFQRLGRLPQGEIADGVIRPADTQVLQLSNDPSFPEQGRLALEMGGGR